MAQDRAREHLPNPYNDLIGVELMEAADGTARIRLPVTARVSGGIHGSVHGGVLSALVDIAAMEAVRTLVGAHEQMAGTADLNISYLRPALGTSVLGVGRVLKKGRALAVADVELTDPDGRLLAKGRVSYALRADR